MPSELPEPVKISRAHDLKTVDGLTQALKEMEPLHQSVLYLVINYSRTVFPEYTVAAGLCYSEIERRRARDTKILTWASVAVSGAVGIMGALLGAWVGANLN